VVHVLVGSNWIVFCMSTVICQACLIVIGSFMLQLSICPRSVWDIIWLIGIWLIGSWSISPKMGGKVASNEHTWPMGVHRSSKVCFSSSALKLVSHQYYKFLVLSTSFYSNLYDVIPVILTVIMCMPKLSMHVISRLKHESFLKSNTFLKHSCIGYLIF
jgi:hypothetical protein